MIKKNFLVPIISSTNYFRSIKNKFRDPKIPFPPPGGEGPMGPKNPKVGKIEIF